LDSHIACLYKEIVLQNAHSYNFALLSSARFLPRDPTQSAVIRINLRVKVSMLL